MSKEYTAESMQDLSRPDTYSSVRPAGAHIHVHMALKVLNYVFNGFNMLLNGLRASSLSPLDSSHNAEN
eukprot:16436599-Heterocapsa_arctica.AAC.1